MFSESRSKFQFMISLKQYLYPSLNTIEVIFFYLGCVIRQILAVSEMWLLVHECLAMQLQLLIFAFYVITANWFLPNLFYYAAWTNLYYNRILGIIVVIRLSNKWTSRYFILVKMDNFQLHKINSDDKARLNKQTWPIVS